jgi:hypothetical protein
MIFKIVEILIIIVLVIVVLDEVKKRKENEMSLIKKINIYFLIPIVIIFFALQMLYDLNVIDKYICGIDQIYKRIADILIVVVVIIWLIGGIRNGTKEEWGLSDKIWMYFLMPAVIILAIILILTELNII